MSMFTFDVLGQRFSIAANRWPWQKRALSGGRKYGWRPTDGMGRFGGGWDWKFGFALGRETLLIFLLFGAIAFRWVSVAEDEARKRRWEEYRKESRPVTDPGF